MKPTKRGTWKGYRLTAGALVVLLLLQLILSAVTTVVDKAQADSPTKYITFLYKDFSQNASRLKFNGAAKPEGTALRLTPAQADTFGSVFNKERLSLSAGSGFSTYFTFNMSGQGSRPGFASGADGLVFALQTKSNSAGSIGSGIGFEGISPSLGIEFDTYNNGSENGDPDDNHIAVDINGVVSHNRGNNPAAVSIPKGTINFKSGSTVHVWIDYDNPAKTIKVYLGTTNSRPATPSLTQGNLDLAQILQSDDVYAGFTAATGSAWENHDIGQWYFTNRYDPIDPTCGCYVESPSLFNVKTSKVDTSVQGAVYYRADIGLTDSAGKSGAHIALVTSSANNSTFLDADQDLKPYDTPPTVQTDSEGNAVIYFMQTDPNGDPPSFRVSTEFGAYQDILITTEPKVETGAVTPKYSPAGANQQSAGAKVQLIKTGGETVTNWGVQYREQQQGDAGWINWPGSSVLEQPGIYTVNLTGLKEDTYYETRAYAQNSKGIVYGAVVPFAIQMEMPADGVKYSRVGPSKIYVDDADSVQVVGTNLYWLLKRLPKSDLSVTITGNGNTYDIPLANLEAVGTTGLKIKLPLQANGAKLALGNYDVAINHAYFDDHTFTSAFTITDDVAYRSINYDEVVVENKPSHPANEVDDITLRGPFVVNASEPNVYRLRDANAIVTLNDNLLFKGTSLVVDNSGMGGGTITGNGRLYVNGKSTIPVLSTYTVYEGNFSLDPSKFSFSMLGTGSAADFTGMNLPVRITSFTFIKGGIRLSGDASVGFNLGSTKIGGEAKVDALDFLKNRFDLAANFKIGAEFKAGPLESGEVRFGIDTRTPEFSAGASAALKKANIGFDIDLLIKDKKLDAISFAVNKDIKIGSTGAQLTKIGGGISNMTSLSEAPLTFSVLGGLSDYITPKISNSYMVNGNDLKVDLSANYFGASGKLAIYKINVASVDMFIVFNPTGYKGYNKAGFDMSANLNLLDILVGQVVVKYFQGTSFTGYAKTAVQIPGSVPLVGGKKLSSAEVGVDESKFKAALSVIGIGFSVKYPFLTKSFDWDVDLSSTVKNVANAVVNTGKKLVKALTSWVWYDDPSQAGEWTAADNGDVPEIVGDKLFGSSDIRATSRGVYDAGQLATVITETNPTVTKTSSGSFSHAFTVDGTYNALISVTNATSGVRLVAPNGSTYGLVYTDDQAKAINAVYDEEQGTLVMEAALTPGVWKLEASSSLGVTVHKELFRNSGSSMNNIVDRLAAADIHALVPLKFEKRGKYLVEINKSNADVKLLKADGRPYATEASESSEAWNTSWNAADGKLYMLVEVPDAGQWLVDAGADAKANLYRMRSNVSMSEALAWRNGSEFATAANFTGLNGLQVQLEINGAAPQTHLFRPDGTPYAFNFDSNSAGWNAIYDEDHHVISALIDVDQDGLWIVKSPGFTDLFGLTLSQKMTMAELNGSDVKYTYSLQFSKKGKYLFDIAGGDASTKIYGVDGKEIVINAVDDTPGQNALLDSESLKVTVDVPHAGTVQIQTTGRATINQYELAPIPTVTKLTAAAQLKRNTYEVSWQINDAKPDTKVSLIMANSADEPVGQVLASDLPASGIQTITLPEGNLPADYYLALVGDSESYGPIFKVLAEPLSYRAAKMLPKPTGTKATASGNGEITLKFTDPGFAQTTSYRVYPADAQGNINYNGKSFDGAVNPDSGAAQSVVLSGLETEQSYRFRVMAIRAEYGTDFVTGEDTVQSLLVSELSDIAAVDLPAPTPAKLSLSYDTGSSPAVAHNYYPYEVTEAQLQGLSETEKLALQQTLTVTASSHVKVKVASDQSVSLKLYLNDVEMPAEAGHPGTFDLGVLAEQVYTIDVEAVNVKGDRSSATGRLTVDRTEPYLYLKTPSNGDIVDGSRAKLQGATETGVVLTINGTVVPVDAIGHFVYYASIPADGVLPLEILATDDAGNKTLHKLEVIKSGVSDPTETDADLAAFGTDEGVLVTPFAANQLNYETAIDVRSKQIRVWAVPVDPSATVTIAGQPVDSQFSALVDITNGSVIQAVVETKDHVQKTYTLQTRLESDLASLSGLDVSGFAAGDAPAGDVELSPGFHGTTLAYEAEVGNEVESVRVKPTAAADGSLIRINGAAATSAQFTSGIGLQVGLTTIKVEVLSPNEAAKAAPDWTQAKVYILKITRKANGQADLQKLELSGIALTPGTFDSAVHAYSARVSAGTSSAQLSFMAADPSATVRLNGTTKGASGIETLSLAEGVNTYVIEVVAPDGTIQTYKLEIYKEKPLSRALLLSELSVKELELTRDFAPLVRNYDSKDSIQNSVVTIVAKPAVEGSVVKVNGVAVNEDGTAQATLQVGLNAVLIQVESPDKSETNTYSVGIVRSFTASVPTDSFSVQINSNKNDKIAVAKRTEENGKTILRVSLLSAETKKLLDAEGQKPVITINAGDSPNRMSTELTADLIKQMQQKDAILQIEAGHSYYTLPASALNIAQIEGAFAPDSLENVKVLIDIRLPGDDEQEAIRKQAVKSGGTVIGTPVEFNVTYTYNGKTLSADRFAQYVERAILLPAGTTAAQVTTGVRVLEDGSLYPVPTYVKHIGANDYAVMNSLTNSVYAVIKHAATFKDIQGKWSQLAIEDLASRLIVNGQSAENFNPTGSVTRAEFAAMIARALGLSGKADASYKDVKTTDWFAPFVSAAQAYGLISGYSDGTFRPSQKITRAEAVAILGKAWTLAGKSAVSEADQATALQGVTDRNDIPAWASASFASAVKLGFISGYEDGSVKPLRSLSREETATMLRNLLIKSELIKQ